MALDIEDRDVSSDPDHGHSGKRLQRAKFTDKIHSLASLVLRHTVSMVDGRCFILNPCCIPFPLIQL
jgi:hypothetical protein